MTATNKFFFSLRCNIVYNILLSKVSFFMLGLYDRRIELTQSFPLFFDFRAVGTLKDIKNKKATLSRY